MRFTGQSRRKGCGRQVFGLLVSVILLAGCVLDVEKFRWIPTPIPPDEDCNSFKDRARDIAQMDTDFMSIVDGRIVFDEDAARADGYSEKSVILAREMAALSDAWLQTRPGDDPPVIPPHVKWFYDCAGEGPGAKE